MLDNVRDFLADHGWKWCGDYYNHELCGYDKAGSFGDIRSSIEHQYTTLKLERGGASYYTEFMITESNFRKYIEKYGVQGSDTEMVLDEDWSEEWLNFCADRLPDDGMEL